MHSRSQGQNQRLDKQGTDNSGQTPSFREQLLGETELRGADMFCLEHDLVAGTEFCDGNVNPG